MWRVFLQFGSWNEVNRGEPDNRDIAAMDYEEDIIPCLCKPLSLLSCYYVILLYFFKTLWIIYTNTVEMKETIKCNIVFIF